MGDFFLILFFSKVILLTPSAINLIADSEFKIVTPIKAITSGASIQIRVPVLPPIQTSEDLLSFDKKLKELYRPGSIAASLKTKSGASVALAYNEDVEKADFDADSYSVSEAFLISSRIRVIRL